MRTAYATPVTQVHQIEVTSRCQLKCSYCPSPLMGKGKPGYRHQLDMSEETFAATLDWVRWFVKQETQRDLNLAGIGESTMHPRFLEYVERAREVIGPDRKLIFATNGLLVTEEMARALRPFNPRVWVSVHIQEKAKRAGEILKRYGLLDGFSTDPTTNGNSWAGQVDSEDSGFRIPCPWIAGGWAFVMADGNIGSCCLDATGITVIGNVKTSRPQTLMNETSKLCRNCWNRLDYIVDFDQSRARRSTDDENDTDRVHLPVA